ncbi:oligopeptide ABC transporter ATP-binding protein OppD, partial [Vibrio parahaemolyticus]
RSFLGHDLATMPAAARDHLLGTRLALVFQDPMASLNPSLTVGLQVAEPGFIHGHRRRREAFRLAVARLGEVGIPNPAARAGRHPHQFSGGM